MDLFSGRTRLTRYFLYCQVGREICETPLSEALAEGQDQERGEEWVKVNVSQPGNPDSPYIVYHEVQREMLILAVLWKLGNLDQEARAKTARQQLRVWREGGFDSAVRPYCDHLAELIDARDSDQPITADDIPDDLADRSPAAFAEEQSKQ